MEIIKKLFRKPGEELKCFEEIADVFHDSEKDFDLVFFPLCSINLNRIIPGRKEWIHFLDVWNNGNIEDAYFHEHRERNAIKFKLENSKYHYYGNEKAFPQYKNLQKWKGEAITEFE